MRRYKEGTFVMIPKRLRDPALFGSDEGGLPIGGGGGGGSGSNAAAASCFEIEGSQEVDEMDGKEPDDDEEEEEDDELEEEEEEDDMGKFFFLT